jgi:hypothetical protein
MKKNNYIQPAVEVLKVKATSVCQAASFTQETGAPISGDPYDGR